MAGPVATAAACKIEKYVDTKHDDDICQMNTVARAVADLVNKSWAPSYYHGGDRNAIPTGQPSLCHFRIGPKLQLWHRWLRCRLFGAVAPFLAEQFFLHNLIVKVHAQRGVQGFFLWRFRFT